MRQDLLLLLFSQHLLPPPSDRTCSSYYSLHTYCHLLETGLAPPTILSTLTAISLRQDLLLLLFSQHLLPPPSDRTCSSYYSLNTYCHLLETGLAPPTILSTLTATSFRLDLLLLLFSQHLLPPPSDRTCSYYYSLNTYCHLLETGLAPPTILSTLTATSFRQDLLLLLFSQHVLPYPSDRTCSSYYSLNTYCHLLETGFAPPTILSTLTATSLRQDLLLLLFSQHLLPSP